MGDWRAANTFRRACELNQPVVVATPPKHPGERRRFSLLRLEPDNLVLAGLKRAEDSADWIVRFYETHGRRTDAALTVLSPFRAAWEVDLLEDKAGPELEIHSGNSLSIPVKPYEIKTVRLRR